MDMATVLAGAIVVALLVGLVLGVAIGTSDGERYWRSKIASECFDQREFGAWEVVQANDSRCWRPKTSPWRDDGAATRRPGPRGSHGPPPPPPKP